jgi:carbamoyltransferase
MKVLGISAFYHDAAACLVEDGTIVAAAQEERFTRVKHDASFPDHAIRYCLAEAGLTGGVLDAVAFYDKPILKFHRILESYFSVAPSGLRAFMRAMPIWLREKLWVESVIEESLDACGVETSGRIYFPEHHESHAASAFYPSPFEDAAVLTVDGVGEWATATVAVGEGPELSILEQLSFPHSLGLLYSAFTSYTGFKVNDAEYKLMGLAPYGEGIYTERIKQELLDLRADGSFRLDMSYFGYLDDLVMTSPRFDALFEGPPRRPEAPIGKREMDLARSVQEVTEEIVVRMARHARERTGKDRLCMAGGVALNCVANGRLLREGIFRELWVQPAAGDAGGAIGAALAVVHAEHGIPRERGDTDGMNGAYLGPEFSRDQIKTWLDACGHRYQEIADDDAWAAEIAGQIADERVVGLFQGRMEFGPRALGNRSIVGDARSPRMQSLLNRKIKFRESFRPFAPAVMEEHVSECFDLDRASPYMLLVAPILEARRVAPRGDEADLELGERLARERSDLPAVTHVDYSARIQTVSRATNPRFHRLLASFRERTGCPAIINTSFNVRDEPIVCTPEDAYRCFARTEMDTLSLGPFVLRKQGQPEGRGGKGFGGAFGA